MHVRLSSWLAATIVSLYFSHIQATRHNLQQPLSVLGNGAVEKFSLEEWKRECKEHRVTGFDTVKGPVELRATVLNEHPFLPKLSAMNDTAWEQWVFDGTSDDGAQSIMVGLCRDPNYAFFGQGNLHIQFYAALGNGKTIKDLVFLDSSSIFDCGDYVAGYWVSAARGYEALFTVNHGSTATALQLTTPRFQGNLTFTATAPPHHLDGSLLGEQPGNHHELDPPSLVVPGLHMFNAIAGAHIKGDIILDGKPLAPRFNARGGGGVLRLWGAADWFNLVSGFRIIRASAGPFSFIFWDSPSRWAGKDSPTYQWGVLYRGAEQLMATRLTTPVADSETSPEEDGILNGQQEDYVHVIQQYGPVGARGKVAGGRSTGHLVHFVSPSSNRTWRFEVEHSVLQGSFPLGGERGVDVFGNRVWGGEVSSVHSPTEESYFCQFHGSAYSEDAMFPERLEPWRIWFVYSISMISQASSTVRNWFARP